MKDSPGSTKRPPALDEVSFQKLLEAAFVLQEHNQRQRENESQPDLNASLSAIVETHKLIQARQLDFRTAVSLVAEQAQRMTGASGVAVGIMEAGQLAYHAATGIAAGDAGTIVSIESAPSGECLQGGKLVQYADLSAASSQGARTGNARGIRALVVAPVYHKGRIAGAFELRFAKPNSFQNQDVGTAQLMAGLVSEAMLVADTSELKSPAPFERNALLDALEKVSPSLKPSADKPPQKEAVPVSPPSQPAPVNPMEDLLREAYATTCAGCGNPLEEGEAFCGSCGMARPGRSGTSTQSKFASLWRMQQAAEKNRGEAPSPSSPPAKLTAPPAVLHSIPAKSSKLPETIPSDTLSPVPAWPGMDASHDVDVPRSMEGENLDHSLAHESTALSIPASLTLSEVEPDLAAETVSQEAEHSLRIIPDEVSDLPVTAKSPWTSARKTREWLDALKHPQGPWITASYWWRQHRANVYVALAALIFSVSVVMLIAAPSHEHAVPESATSAAHRRKAPPPPEMTMFEKFLVSIGLAEPPDAPAYMGNPNAKVWVDVHTALYYCPGAELYGKTEGGKFTTQRDAQQDQFQPASRKVCD